MQKLIDLVAPVTINKYIIVGIIVMIVLQHFVLCGTDLELFFKKIKPTCHLKTVSEVCDFEIYGHSTIKISLMNVLYNAIYNEILQGITG